MFKYDIYVAGPFFNDAQKARMDSIITSLEGIGLRVADPRKLGPVIVDTNPALKTEKFFEDIFRGNIKGMDDSVMLLANLDDKDIGTAFELGYFYRMNRHMFSCAFEGGKTNVMLGHAVHKHFDNLPAMVAFFKSEYDAEQSLDFAAVFEKAGGERMGADQ